MTPAHIFALVLVAFVAAIACLIASQHRPQDLPLVESAAPGPDMKAPMLFAPCPLSPMQVPPPIERTA